MLLSNHKYLTYHTTRECDLFADEREQYWFDFPNGLSASVICGPGTYGGREGLYEFSVIKDGECYCGTPIMYYDVIGYLTEDEAIRLVDRTASLKCINNKWVEL